ncbi:MAG: hypothetical protein ABWX56_08340 [Mycetocola sp.]
MFGGNSSWRGLFYGNFHGYNSAGLGASDQTGWTALVARMMQVIGNELEPATKVSTRTPNPPAGHDGGHTGCRPERGTPAPLGAKHNGANGEGNRDGSSQNESAIHVNRSSGDFSHGLI